MAAPIRSAGKRARSTAGYVILAALMLVTPLLVFLPAALFHCAIRNGRRAAWIVLPAAAALALLMLMPGAMAPQTAAAEARSTIAALLGLVFVVGLPSLLALPMVERAERFGRVLAFALLLGVGGMLATEVLMQLAASFSPFAAHTAVAREMATQLLAAYTKAGIPADTVRLLRKVMNFVIFVQPAVLLIYAAIVFAFSLVMLGRLPAWRQFVARRGLPTPTPYLFRNLALPEWVLFAFVLGGLSPLASGLAQRVGANVLVVVAFLYLMQGLAIFRSFMVAAGAGIIGTLLAYGTLALLTLMGGIAPLLLSIAGLFDSFFDFRHFNRKDHSDESHSH
ncbi:MAG: DUF2232 domain-containing protein [Acidobacteriota bacterium]